MMNYQLALLVLLLTLLLLQTLLFARYRSQQKDLLSELRIRLATDLEQWSRFESLAQSPKAKEMAREKVSQLQSQLAAVQALL